MAGTRRGRVRAGITGYHPGLKHLLVPGTELDIPDEQWSEVLFEAVTPTEAELPYSFIRRGQRVAAPTEEE